MSETNLYSRRHFVASALSTATLALLPGHFTTDDQVQKMKGEEMMILTPYLLFDGNCHQAMEFYKSCFGGELALTKVKDSPAKNHLPAVQQDKVLNARLRSGDLEISASDWLRSDQTAIRGNTVCLFLSGGTIGSWELHSRDYPMERKSLILRKSNSSVPMEHSTTDSVSGGCFTRTKELS